MQTNVRNEITAIFDEFSLPLPVPVTATKVTLPARKIIIGLFVLVLIVNAIGLVGRIVEHLIGYEGDTEFVKLFRVGLEGNVTTWFSSMLLFISALLLAVIAGLKRKLGAPYTRHWILLSLIFLYLSIDEAARIHELAIDPLRSSLDAGGIFYFAWVIVAIPLVLLFAVAYWRFLWALPRRTAFLFAAAGIIYVAGAMGMDMIDGVILGSGMARADTIVGALTILEELLENVGIALFISALIWYLQQDQLLNEFTVAIES